MRFSLSSSSPMRTAIVRVLARGRTDDWADVPLETPVAVNLMLGEADIVALLTFFVKQMRCFERGNYKTGRSRREIRPNLEDESARQAPSAERTVGSAGDLGV